MTRVLAINGSYRDDGVTDRLVESLVQGARDAGAEVEVVILREEPIEFCLNCRACTQEPGSAPGHCVLDDGMRSLVERIESADAYIFAAPTNLGSVTALFKRFMERLIVYAYWPWGAKFPLFRKAGESRKPAVVVSSSAAPGVIGRWSFGSIRQLKYAAKVVGADTVGVLHAGGAAARADGSRAADFDRRVSKLVRKLLP